MNRDSHKQLITNMLTLIEKSYSAYSEHTNINRQESVELSNLVADLFRSIAQKGAIIEDKLTEMNVPGERLFFNRVKPPPLKPKPVISGISGAEESSMVIVDKKPPAELFPTELGTFEFIQIELPCHPLEVNAKPSQFGINQRTQVLSFLDNLAGNFGICLELLVACAIATDFTFNGSRTMVNYTSPEYGKNRDLKVIDHSMSHKRKKGESAFQLRDLPPTSSPEHTVVFPYVVKSNEGKSTIYISERNICYVHDQDLTRKTKRLQIPEEWSSNRGKTRPFYVLHNHILAVSLELEDRISFTYSKPIGVDIEWRKEVKTDKQGSLVTVKLFKLTEGGNNVTACFLFNNGNICLWNTAKNLEERFFKYANSGLRFAVDCSFNHHRDELSVLTTDSLENPSKYEINVHKIEKDLSLAKRNKIEVPVSDSGKPWYFLSSELENPDNTNSQFLVFTQSGICLKLPKKSGPVTIDEKKEPEERELIIVGQQFKPVLKEIFFNSTTTKPKLLLTFQIGQEDQQMFANRAIIELGLDMRTNPVQENNETSK